MSESTKATPFNPIWTNIDNIASFSPAPGVEMRAVAGERLMMNFVMIAPGAIVPNHHHHHEQAGTILDGVLILTIAGETRNLGRGDAYLIPGGVEHSATTDADGCTILDVFSPPREDYLPGNR